MKRAERTELETTFDFWRNKYFDLVEELLTQGQASVVDRKGRSHIVRTVRPVEEKR